MSKLKRALRSGKITQEHYEHLSRVRGDPDSEKLQTRVLGEVIKNGWSAGQTKLVILFHVMVINDSEQFDYGDLLNLRGVLEDEGLNEHADQAGAKAAAIRAVCRRYQEAESFLASWIVDGFSLFAIRAALELERELTASGMSIADFSAGPEVGGAWLDSLPEERKRMVLFSLAAMHDEVAQDEQSTPAAGPARSGPQEANQWMN